MKKFLPLKKVTSIALAVLLVLCSVATYFTYSALKSKASVEKLEITNMLINGLKSPIGIDTEPVFSWTNETEGYDRSMSAYRIVVASTMEKAAAGEGDLWDSGKTLSNKNFDILYNGAKLSSRTAYFWRVEVYDEKDNLFVSEVASFETGMLDSSDWQAKWIGIDLNNTFTFDGASWIWTNEQQYHVPTGVRYFRYKFTPDSTKSVLSVVIGSIADDSHTLYYNGQEIATSTSWIKGTYADLTDKTVSKQNTICVKATNTHTNTGSYAGLILKAVITYTDGTKDIISTNGNWKVTSEEETGWKSGSFDASHWQNATVIGDNTIAPWGAVSVKTNLTSNDLGAPMFRKEFNVSKTVSKARMYICGLGLFELKINGALPDDTVLNPVNSQYEQTVCYRVFDVTKLLLSGDNAIAVELGNSFYNENFTMWNTSNAQWRDDPKLIAQLHIDYTDGTSDVISTDTTWKYTTDGPVTYNSIYYGEKYDARLEIDGWDKASFDDSSWKNAVLDNAPGTLRFQNMEPMRRLNKFDTVITRLDDGTYIVKTPVITTGWAKITFNEAKAGDKITIIYGETLKEDGRVKQVNWGATYGDGRSFQICEYTAKGVKGETYEPKYTYCGYEYIEIVGYTGILSANDIECYLIANDVEQVSTFETSNELINKLHANMQRALINNFQGKPTDCPTYEKLGWLGDYNVVTRSAMFNYGIESFNANFMNTIRDTSKTFYNRIANYSPTAEGAYNAVIWSAAYNEAIYESWRYYGTLNLVKDHYELMRKTVMYYVDEIKVQSESGGLIKWPWTYSHTLSLNDWQAPDGPSSTPEGSSIIGTAMIYNILEHMAEMADAIGRTADAQEYRGYMQNIYTAFNLHFYNAEKGYYESPYWNESNASTRTKYRQTSNLCAVYFGLCPEDRLESVVKSIADDVVAKGIHLDTGLVGTRQLLPVLSENGYAELAYQVITQTTYPSWGFWVENGATSCWEGYPINGTRSRNHYFLGSYDQWIFENLAGFDTFSEGFTTLTVRPQVLNDLDFMNCTMKTVRGTLTSNWKKYDDGTFEMLVQIPTGTTATIYVPVGSVDNLRVNGILLSEQKGIRNYVVENGYVKITAGSGNYEFISGDIVNNNSTETRSELEALVATATTLSSANYSPSAFLKLQNEIADANLVLSNAASSGTQLSIAKLQLSTQLALLSENKTGNLALKMPVTAAGTLNAGSWGNVANITDGDLKNLAGNQNTGWCCSAFNADTYFIIDLGATYKLNCVRLYATGCTTTNPLCTWFPKSYDILVSNNNSTWETVASESGFSNALRAESNGVGPSHTSYFDTVEARYIKIDITGFQDKINWDWYAQISEAEVFCVSEDELELRTLIDECKLLAPESYLTHAYNDFKTVLDDVINSNLDNSVAIYNASVALNRALDDLSRYTLYNLVLNKTPIPSSILGAGNPEWNKASNLVDGDRNNISSSGEHCGWSSVGYAKKVTIDFDLGRKYTFNTVELYPTGFSGANAPSRTFPKTFEIQISNDNTNWTTVYRAESVPIPNSDANGNPIPHVCTFNSVNARYVRAYLIEPNAPYKTPWGSTDQYIQLSEIEIYNNVGYTLNDLIKEAEAISSENYPTNAWTAFTESLNDATRISVLGNADEKADAAKELSKAISVLKKSSYGNLALNSKVIASSEIANAGWNNPDSLTDGDRKNISGSQHQGWSSAYGDAGVYVQLDLGDVYNFNTVDLYPTGCIGANAPCYWFPKSFMIQVSTNATNWITVYTATNIERPYSDANGNAPRMRYSFDAIDARFIRVQVTELLDAEAIWGSSKEQYAQLAEIEVYNLTNKLIAANLELGESLTLNYYANLEDICSSAVLEVTRDGEAVQIPGVIDKETGYYKFSFKGINPQCMTDEFDAVLKINRTELDKKNDYSIKSYAQRVFANNDEDLRTLLAAMLVYGEAAQKYTGYKADDLATTGVDFIAAYAPDELLVTEGTRNVTNVGEVNKVNSVGLNFSNHVKVYFRFTCDGTVPVTLNGKAVDLSTLKVEDGKYVIYSEPLTALDFDLVQTLRVGDSTVEYNVNAYVLAKKDSATAGELAKALGNYGIAAENFAS